MDVNAKVELFQDKINKLQEASQKAFEMTVEAVLTDIKVSQVVPKDTSMLEDSGFTEINIEAMIGTIIFDTPYARKLYWHPEYDFRADKNPNAQGLWMQTYFDGPKKDFIKNTYVVFLKQLSGGLIK